MADRYIPEHRRTQFKAKNAFKPEELRRRREEQQVEIRKSKREENLAKRRGLGTGERLGASLGAAPDSDDETAPTESQVSLCFPLCVPIPSSHGGKGVCIHPSLCITFLPYTTSHMHHGHSCLPFDAHFLHVFPLPISLGGNRPATDFTACKMLKKINPHHKHMRRRNNDAATPEPPRLFWMQGVHPADPLPTLPARASETRYQLLMDYLFYSFISLMILDFFNGSASSRQNNSVYANGRSL